MMSSAPVIGNLFEKDFRARFINDQDKRVITQAEEAKIKARSDYSNWSRSDDRQARCGRRRFTRGWST
jgi:hypothetical protein